MVSKNFAKKQCIIPRNKVISGNPLWRLKILYILKIKGLIIQYLGKVSIRYLIYSQRLCYYWLIVERFLVCQVKSGRVLGPKAAPE